mmetsp:Transcript_7936/g.25959  ORF Transcript_7936/g.25959 Transcript_7936/m.25959 type:complete len:238 (+) Transcript_7936:1663-2376(+)
MFIDMLINELCPSTTVAVSERRTGEAPPWRALLHRCEHTTFNDRKRSVYRRSARSARARAHRPRRADVRGLRLCDRVPRDAEALRRALDGAVLGGHDLRVEFTVPFAAAVRAARAAPWPGPTLTQCGRTATSGATTFAEVVDVFEARGAVRPRICGDGAALPKARGAVAVPLGSARSASSTRRRLLYVQSARRRATTSLTSRILRVVYRGARRRGRRTRRAPTRGPWVPGRRGARRR